MDIFALEIKSVIETYKFATEKLHPGIKPTFPIHNFPVN